MLRFSCLLLFLLAAPANAQSFSGVAPPDPFVLNELPAASTCSWMSNRGYTNTTGKTVRNLTINTGIKNLVLILAGQSNRVAVNPSAYTPTNGSAIDNFSIYDGSVYAWADPPLGSTYQGPCGGGAGSGHLGARIADKFITAGAFDRVIVVPLAISGSSIADWATGNLKNRLCVAMARLSARGFTAQSNVTVAIEWGQGETDTTLATSQSAYQTALSTVISNVRNCSINPFTGRFFVATETYVTGSTSSAVQAAQAAVIDNSTVFASGNLDTIGSGSRFDNLHFNDAGAASAATLIYNAMHASGAPF